ncbi:MAG: hypothetical protein PHU63_01665 [Candidatus ainarchaeum sp.]|nr:hypothetical protein [Candidatus ainarchaeum sp.]
MEIAYVFAVVLSLIHFFGEKIVEKIQKHNEEIKSFASGLLLSFVFLELLGKMTQGISEGYTSVYFFVLLGFSIFHILNKYIYVHSGEKKERIKELGELHFVGFSIDMFFMGVVLSVFLTTNSQIFPLIIALPLILHMCSLTLSTTLLYKKFRVKKRYIVLISLFPILGVLASSLFIEILEVFYYILGFVAGLIIYFATRHIIPKDNKGKIEWYVFGVVLGTLMVFFS